MEWCISTTSFSVLINGTPTSFLVVPGAEDNLFPYLFIIGMEAFTHLINKAVQGNFLAGVTSVEEELIVSHLIAICCFTG